MQKSSKFKETLKKYGIGTGDVTIFAVILVLTAVILIAALGTKHLSRIQQPENAPGTVPILEEPSGTAADGETEDTETAEASESDAASDAEKEMLPEGSAVEQILAEMTLEEKIWQLFIVTPEVLVENAVSCVTETGDMSRTALRNMPVGGLIYFSQNLESPEQTERMISGIQDCAAENGGIGLWIAVDEEGGLVARVADHLGTTAYQPMAVYGAEGDTDAVYEIGADIAADISQFGFNLDFAPVADVDISPENELGDRIFSDDPQVVSEMAAAMVKGLQDGGVSATLKHFPGLGAESGNTHDDAITYIERSYEELAAEDFIGFQGGIDAGADFVMVGHHVISCAGDDLPSDLSPVVVTEWLRNDLGFDGIVITDAHNMNTISGNYTAGEAAKLAILAGVDIVLMPVDLEAAFMGVYDAVQSGEIPETQINESVMRILKAKEKHGLIG